MSKLILIGVGATAYLLGAKAGRERYDQIAGAARRCIQNERVRDRTSQAAQLLEDKAPDADQVAGVARHAAEKIRPHGGDDGESPSAQQTDTTRSG